MSLIAILISLVIWALFFWLVWWFLSQVPLPEPFMTVIRVVIALIAVLVIFSLLTGALAPVSFGYRI